VICIFIFCVFHWNW